MVVLTEGRRMDEEGGLVANALQLGPGRQTVEEDSGGGEFN